MEQDEGILYEYAVVRYVPRVHRQEFVNVGLLMMSKRNRWLRGRVWLDVDRLRGFDREVDIEGLARVLKLMERSDVPSAQLPVEERFRWLAAKKSAVVQVSPTHPGIIVGDYSSAAEALSDTFDRLFAELVM